MQLGQWWRRCLRRRRRGDDILCDFGVGSAVLSTWNAFAQIERGRRSTLRTSKTICSGADAAGGEVGSTVDDDERALARRLALIIRASGAETRRPPEARHVSLTCSISDALSEMRTRCLLPAPPSRRPSRRPSRPLLRPHCRFRACEQARIGQSHAMCEDRSRRYRVQASLGLVAAAK